MAQARADLLEDLPPSAKLVYKVLEYRGPLTQKGIAEESLLSARTVRYAIDRLEEAGAIEDDIHFADARQNIYRLRSDPTSCDGSTNGARCAE